MLSIFTIPTFSQDDPFHKRLIQAEDNCFASNPNMKKEHYDAAKLTLEIDKHADDEDFKCFLACIGKELELVSDVGEFHSGKLIEMTKEMVHEDVDHAQASDWVDQCSNSATAKMEAGACEMAFAYVKCKFTLMEGKNSAKKSVLTATNNKVLRFDKIHFN